MPVGTPAPRLVQSYRLGTADYSPPAAIERLDAVIKYGRLQPLQLSLAAQATRDGEQAGYRDALTQLKAMGAPGPVTAPYPPAIHSLTVPLAITDTAKQQVPDDPQAQQVWSTLDEAERVAPPSNGVLTSWLKLSHGRDALWAYRLGLLCAVIRAGIPGDASRLPLIHGAGALAEAAPLGCPQPLVDALKTVAQQANENKVDADSLAALDQRAQNVFGPGFSPLALPAPVFSKQVR